MFSFSKRIHKTELIRHTHVQQTAKLQCFSTYVNVKYVEFSTTYMEHRVLLSWRPSLLEWSFCPFSPQKKSRLIFWIKCLLRSSSINPLSVHIKCYGSVATLFQHNCYINHKCNVIDHNSYFNIMQILLYVSETFSDE